MPRSFVDNLQDNTRAQMIELLNSRLVDTIDLVNAVKQAHWNIKGPGFIGVHELLDQIADRLRDSADLMAERAVILGGVAQGTIQAAQANTTLQPYPLDIIHIEEHIKALEERFLDLGAKLREAMATAGEVGDEGTADLFTEVSRSVDKDAWFIGANRVES